MGSIHRLLCILFTMATIIITPSELLSKFSFKTLYTIFDSHTQQEIVQKEYAIDPLGTLTIENMHGNIEVAIGWKKNTVILKAIIETTSPHENRQQLLHEEYTHKQLILKSKPHDTKWKGCIHYQLVVPVHLALNLSTLQGTITIKENQGSITAITTEGSIEIYNTTGTVHTHVHKIGSITIANATGPIHASTMHGNITIQQSKNNIFATTQKGRINMIYDELALNSHISAQSNSGNITLTFPTTTNATIYGKTEYGTITSEHYLTLKPQTTKLNTHAWSRFKKEVEGVIGNGTSRIKLNSIHGNIKILEPSIAT